MGREKRTLGEEGESALELSRVRSVRNVEVVEHFCEPSPKERRGREFGGLGDGVMLWIFVEKAAIPWETRRHKPRSRIRCDGRGQRARASIHMDSSSAEDSIKAYLKNLQGFNLSYTRL